jgi:hypothetical protein
MRSAQTAQRAIINVHVQHHTYRPSPALEAPSDNGDVEIAPYGGSDVVCDFLLSSNRLAMNQRVFALLATHNSLSHLVWSFSPST